MKSVDQLLILETQICAGGDTSRGGGREGANKLSRYSSGHSGWRAGWSVLQLHNMLPILISIPT